MRVRSVLPFTTVCLLMLAFSAHVSAQGDANLHVFLSVVDSYRSGAVTEAMRAMVALNHVQVDAAVDLLRARLIVEDGDSLRNQVQAAALLHTEIVVSGAVEISPDRRWHLATAKHLVDAQQLAGGSAASRERSLSFARRWALVVAWYDHGMLDVEALAADVADLTSRFSNDPDVLLLKGSFAETLAWSALPATIAVPVPLTNAARDRKGRLGDARSAYERALQLAPGLDEARLRLGRVYDETNEHEGAMEAFRSVVRATNNAWLRYLAQLFWGRACERLDHTQEAIEHYQEASKICAECQVPAIALSNALRKTGDREAMATAATSAVAGARREGTNDPWREYYCGQYHRLPAMLFELRKEVAR